MTITRKYFESLIDLFAQLNAVQQNDPASFIVIKKDISNLLDRINKFNLFPLTFSESFLNLLYKKTIDNFVQEKLSLVNELHFELHECLYTTRLRYGGELMHYIYILKIKLLNLSLEELHIFETIKKTPIHYYFPEKFLFKTEQEKKDRIKALKSELKRSEIKKEKIKIKEKDFELIETQLNDYFTKYKTYINTNYPAISDLFSFNNKKNRAYITGAMSKEIFEFRIHSYISNSKHGSINLLREYYDFYPAYFYNLEEISEKQHSAQIIGIKRNGYAFENPFAIKHIHRELVNIFLQNSKENDIIAFTEFLLKCDGFKIIPNDNYKDNGFDLLAIKSETKNYFEIFHHKTRSIDIISKRIKIIKNESGDIGKNIVFTSYPGESIIKLLRENKITPIYFDHLISKYFNLENSQILHWYVQSKINTLKFKNTQDTSFVGQNLIKRLQECPNGEKNWAEYENIGIAIFKFLFEDNFKSYFAEEQVENDLKNHRRDLIVSNYYKDPSSFWAEIKQEYKAKAIIVDFKNYSEKLNSSTLFSVTKYTTKKIGNFAIVFSRKGIDKTAIIEQKSLLSEGKLVIEFNDNELIEMINEKTLNKDPLDRLKSKEFELVKK
jgi:hypothetical protein